MLKWLSSGLLIIILLGASSLYASDGQGASGAPNYQTFATDPDWIGALEESVNLFTGDANLSIPLVSLSGRNGLDVSVALAYSSNIHKQVRTWNREAPTGVVGLGWTLPLDRILVDEKGTGTYHDNTYYLQSGGSTSELVRIDATDVTPRSYATIQYKFWDITYDPVNEQWEIVKENGLTFIYGDKNSGRSTVQWGVKWGNWIGNSALTTGQEHYATAWNLSAIQDQWGNEITYSYLNVEQKVGGSAGLLQTEASYLQQITGTYGRSIVFSYASKGANEFTEPHTEVDETQSGVYDGYQEYYQRRYLDYLTVRAVDGSIISTVDFEYYVQNATFDDVGIAKRYLLRMTESTPAGGSLPSLEFAYYTDPVNDTHFGALKQVTFPTGGTATYSYTEQSLSGANKRLHINRPSIYYSEPRVWVAEDYVVVSWYESMGDWVDIYVYHWDGQWHTSDRILRLTDMNKINGIQDFEIKTMRKAFAVIEHYYDASEDLKNLHIIDKDPYQNDDGAWDVAYTHNVYAGISGGNRRLLLMEGDRFFSMIDQERGYIHRYRWDGSTWEYTYAGSVEYQNDEDHFGISGRNYIIYHDQNETSDDFVAIHYLDETGNWHSNTLPGPLTLQTDNGSAHRTLWYAGSNYAVGRPKDDYGYIYWWDPHYQFINDRESIVYEYPGSNNFSSVHLVGPQVGILQADFDPLPEPHHVKTALVYRFNGSSWDLRDLSAYYELSDFDNWAFGLDYALKVNGGSNETEYHWDRIDYDPNSNSWSTQLVDLTEASNETNPGTKAAHAYYIFGEKVYYRNSNGPWAEVFTLPHQYALVKDATTPIGATFFKYHDISTGNAYIVPIRNGKAPEGAVQLNGYANPQNALVGPYTVVTHSHADLVNSTSLDLYRVINGTGETTQFDYPVTSLEINNGLDIVRTIGYEYTSGTAIMDPSGTMARYEQVSVSPVGDGSHGRTNYWFFNGRHTTIHSQYLALMGQIRNTSMQNANYQSVGSSSRTYDVVTKQLGQQAEGVYSRLQEQSTTVDGVTSTVSLTYHPDNGQVRERWEVNSDGSTRITRNTYAFELPDYQGMVDQHMLSQVAQQTVYEDAVRADSARASSITTYKNWFGTGAWGAERSYNWQETRGDLLAASGPDFSMPSFSYWQTTQNPPAGSEWKYSGSILSRKSNGDVIESQDVNLIKTCVNYGDHAVNGTWINLPMAYIKNSGTDEAFFDGFESANFTGATLDWYEGGSGLRTISNEEAHSGDYAVKFTKVDDNWSGMFTQYPYIRVIPGKEYTCNVWFKTDADRYAYIMLYDVQNGLEVGGATKWGTNNWEQLQLTITAPLGCTELRLYLFGHFGVSGANTPIYYDDIRVHPADAMMTHRNYVENTLQVQSSSDVNNSPSSTWYDQFNRPIAMLNHEHTILSHNATYYSRTGNGGHYNTTDPNYAEQAVFAAGPSTRELRGYWTFEDHGFDVTGRNPAASVNAPYRRGLLGRGIQGDGNDFVNVTDGGVSNLDVAGPALTMSAWVYPTADNSNMIIMNKESSYEIQLKYNATYDSLDFQVAIATDQQSWLWQTLGRVKRDQWSHVAATYDGQYIRGYINGEYTTSYSRTGNVLQNDKDFRIGARGGDGSPTSFFYGKLDEIQVYAQTLTASEIRSLATPTISTTYTDGIGRSLQDHTRDGDHEVIQTSTYNSLGKIDRAYHPVRLLNADHLYTPVSPSIYEQYSYETDPRARMAGITHPDGTGRTTSYSYDGNYFLATVTNEKGIQSRTKTDRFGNVVEQVAALGTTDQRTSSSAFDILGNVRRTTDPRGLITRYWYGSDGQLIQEMTPDAGIQQYLHNPAGQLVYSQDANQAQQNHFKVVHRDVLGRTVLVGIETGQAHAWSGTDYPAIDDVGSYGTGSGEVKLQHWYDTDYTGEPNVPHGRLTKAVNAENNTTTLYAYDREGNILLKEIQIPGLAAQRIYHQYDAHGREVLTEYPSGRIVTKKFNALGQLESIGTVQ